VTENNEQRRHHWKDGWASLSHRDFRLLWFGTLISNAGSWMQKVATSWLVYQLTGSQLLLGVDAFASGISTVLLLPLGGVIADRLDRRKLLIWTNIISTLLAGVLAVLAATGTLAVWHIITVSALSGIVQAAMVPASTSLLPSLVGEADVPNAIALNSLQFNLSRVLGPAVGGFVLVKFGAPWSFTLNAASFLVLVFAFVLIRTVPAIPQNGLSFGHALADGVRFTKHRGDLSMLLALVTVTAFLAAPVVSLMPAFVKEVLGRDASSYSMMLSSFGVGAVIASLLIAALDRGRRPKWITWLSLILLGCVEAALVASGSIVFAVLLVAIAGMLFVGTMIRLGTTILQTTPDAYRGRVSSLQQVGFRLGQPLGALAAGWLGTMFGVRTAFVGFGLMLIAVTLASRFVPQKASA